MSFPRAQPEVSRVLTTARVEVGPDEEKYLRLVADQAEEFGARGFHLWVFRCRDEAGVFLEFREGRGPTPGWMDERLDTIRQRDRELRAMVRYTGESTIWDEVALDRSREG